jgi:uncharacterized protein YjbI with pentapeptide repeats
MRPVAIIGGIALAIGAYLGAVLFVPGWWIAHPKGLALADRLAAEAAVRQSIIFLGGGALAVVGMSYTHRRHGIDRRTNELQEDSNYTDRYAAAITQLGSDKLTIRLGGVYALERIARDSADDAETVQDVLAAFIREDSPRGSDEAQLTLELGAEESSPYVAPLDVAAAMTVLSRRTEERAWNRPRIDLGNAAIGAIRFQPGAALSDARLDGANLAGAEMHDMKFDSTTMKATDLSRCSGVNASFVGVLARGAFLRKSKLQSANFSDADLSQASMVGAILTGTRFVNAKLYGADFTSATLDGTLFEDADVKRAIFKDSNLTGADLSRVVNWHSKQLHSASSWSSETKWPEEFEPVAPFMAVNSHLFPPRAQQTS